MAQLGVYGLDELGLSMAELFELPDSVMLDMLRAEGAVVKEAQIRSIQETFSRERSQQLEQSLHVDTKLRRGKSGAYITVYPKGTRGNQVRNAEVGFVGEFGAPGRSIAPTQWMRRANEAAAEAAVQAAKAIYDNWLSERGL